MYLGAALEYMILLLSCLIITSATPVFNLTTVFKIIWAKSHIFLSLASGLPPRPKNLNFDLVTLGCQLVFRHYVLVHLNNKLWKYPMKKSIIFTLYEILIKSIKHDLSYNLKCDMRSISKSTFVPIGVLVLLVQSSKRFFSKQWI